MNVCKLKARREQVRIGRRRRHTYRDGGGVVGEEAAVEGRDVALRRRRPVLLGLRRREGEEVVAAGADEEEGAGEQLAHRPGPHLGLHLGLGRLEQTHLLRQRDVVSRVLHTPNIYIFKLSEHACK